MCIVHVVGNLTCTCSLIVTIEIFLFKYLQGAEVNVRDHVGWTPLHEACNHGYLEVAQVLLDHGANIDDPGGTLCGGVTPLVDAAFNGHVDIVSLLVERGSDINISNSNVSGCAYNTLVGF